MRQLIFLFITTMLTSCGKTLVLTDHPTSANYAEVTMNVKVHTLGVIVMDSTIVKYLNLDIDSKEVNKLFEY